MTDAQWRENTRRNRIATARNGMAGALQEMGNTVNTYFTPEERLAFAHFAESKRNGMTLDDVETFAIPLAESASLADQEARWRFEWMMYRAELAELLSQCPAAHRFAATAWPLRGTWFTMEQFAGKLPSEQRSAPLVAAADAYRSAGDEAKRTADAVCRFFPERSRPYDLSAFLPIAAGAATGRACAHRLDLAGGMGRAGRRLRGCERKSLRSPMLWSRLAAKPSAHLEQGLQRACGTLLRRADARCEQRIPRRSWRRSHWCPPRQASRPRPSNLRATSGSTTARDMANIWARQSWRNAEDFLPAILEESPASASGYLTLADYYARRWRHPARHRRLQSRARTLAQSAGCV